MTTVCFIHDAPLVENPNSGEVYSQGFAYPIWERYLEVFDNLIIATRMRAGSARDLAQSSGPRVQFMPVRSYRGVKDLLTRLPKICRELGAAVDSADAVVIRLPSILGWIGYFIATLKRKQVLIELVGCPYDTYKNFGPSGKSIAPLAAALTRFQVRRAPFCIYVTKDYLQKKYPNYGINRSISNVQLHNQPINPREHQPTDTLRFGSVGKIDLRYKGFHTMIDALPQLPGVHYEIVGSGDGAALRNLAEIRGVSDRVTFVGPLPPNDVMHWLDSIDVYVQPSLTEGLPRAVIEAMSRELPVLGSDVGGIPELLEPDWLFAPGDTGALVKTVQLLIACKDWTAIGQLNRDRSKEYDTHKLQTERSAILKQLRGQVIK